MTIYYTILGLIILAGISNAFMDASSQGWFKNPWMNKETGSKYKWKNGDDKQGPAFFLSTTILVGYTDFWHLAQLVFHSSWQLAFALSQDFYNPLWVFLGVKVIFGLWFECIYRWLKGRMKRRKIEVKLAAPENTYVSYAKHRAEVMHRLPAYIGYRIFNTTDNHIYEFTETGWEKVEPDMTKVKRFG